MGIPLMRTKTWAYAIGAFFGGVAGAYYASFKGARFPRTSTSTSPSSSSAWSSSAESGASGACIAGGMILSYLNTRASRRSARRSRTRASTSSRRNTIRVLRGASSSSMMLFRPAGLIPERRHRIELEEGVHDTPFYDVQTRGHAHRPRPVRRLMAEPDNLVVATQVRKEFGGLVATDDVDFTIPRGAIVSLIGPNGAGKTTFFNQLTGVYKPTSGSIVFDGTEVSYLPPHTITKLGIGRTFQNIRLFHADDRGRERPRRDALPAALAGILGSILRTPKVKREEAAAREKRARAPRLLRSSASPRRAVGLAPVRRSAPTRGRSRTRHRSEAPPPRRADRRHEPAGDRRVHVVRRRVRDDEDVTVLLIEHDMKVVMGVSERITVLEYGAKIAEGTPAEITDERARHRGVPRQRGDGMSEAGAHHGTSSSSTTSTSTTGRSTRSRASRSDVRAGRDRHAHRRQRRRQVDDVAGDQRAQPPASRVPSVSRAQDITGAPSHDDREERASPRARRVDGSSRG